MSHPLEGILRFITLSETSAGAGNCDTDIRPPQNCYWEVLYLYGTQNDGAVACGWLITDKDNTKATVIGITGASGVPWYFAAYDDTADADDHMYGPPVLSYETYLTFRFAASAASKVSTVRALVKEFRGVAPHNWQELD